MTRKEYLQEAIKEMKRYEMNWSYMSPKERKDIGCTKKELKQRIKDYEMQLKEIKQ